MAGAPSISFRAFANGEDPEGFTQGLTSIGPNVRTSNVLVDNNAVVRGSLTVTGAINGTTVGGGNGPLNVVASNTEAFTVRKTTNAAPTLIVNTTDPNSVGLEIHADTTNVVLTATGTSSALFLPVTTGKDVSIGTNAETGGSIFIGTGVDKTVAVGSFTGSSGIFIGAAGSGSLRLGTGSTRTVQIGNVTNPVEIVRNATVGGTFGVTGITTLADTTVAGTFGVTGVAAINGITIGTTLPAKNVTSAEDSVLAITGGSPNVGTKRLNAGVAEFTSTMYTALNGASDNITGNWAFQRIGNLVRVDYKLSFRTTGTTTNRTGFQLEPFHFGGLPTYTSNSFEFGTAILTNAIDSNSAPAYLNVTVSSDVTGGAHLVNIIITTRDGIFLKENDYHDLIGTFWYTAD